jgi:cobalt-zinc-cadmium efflux system protein
MHDHAPTGIRGASNRRLLTISLCLTATVMLVQVVGALLTGSLALLADAAHMFTDSSALVVALIASTVAARPANDRNTYGYQRAEVFGALVNAVILIALMVWIAVEAVQRLLAPSEVEVAGALMLLVAAVGLGANAVSMYLLSAAQKPQHQRARVHRGARRSHRLGAGHRRRRRHLDDGMDAGDALASLLIAVMILPRAIGLLREVFSVLGSARRGDRGRGDPRSHPRRGRRRRRARRARVAAHPWRSGLHRARRRQRRSCLPGIGGNGCVAVPSAGVPVPTLDVEHSTFQFEPAGHREHEAHV